MQDDSEVLRFVFADCLVARASKRQTALSTARAKSVRFGIFSLIDYLFRNHEPWVQVVNETELPLMYRYPSCLTSLNAWSMFQIPPKSRMAISVIIGKQNPPLFWGRPAPSSHRRKIPAARPGILQHPRRFPPRCCIRPAKALPLYKSERSVSIYWVSKSYPSHPVLWVYAHTAILFYHKFRQIDRGYF